MTPIVMKKRPSIVVIYSRLVLLACRGQENGRFLRLNKVGENENTYGSRSHCRSLAHLPAQADPIVWKLSLVRPFALLLLI